MKVVVKLVTALAFDGKIGYTVLSAATSPLIFRAIELRCKFMYNVLTCNDPTHMAKELFIVKWYLLKIFEIIMIITKLNDCTMV